MDVAALLTPPPAGHQQNQWLTRVASLLRGFRSVPLVLRHHALQRGENYKADVEVRRWSGENYLRLSEDSGTWLDNEGRLFRSEPQRRRWIRQHSHEQIYDEVYVLTRIAQASAEQLNLVLDRLVAQHGTVFWRAWEQLPEEQQERLARVAHSWEVLQPALDECPLRAQAVLPVLLSEKAHPRSRAALLEAGVEGSYAPPAEVLPWLLLQVEWNLSPGVLGLTRASLRRFPLQAWNLRQHPNPVVRRRLAQLLADRQPWLDWLVCEGEGSVRQALRLRLEAETPLNQLAEQLRFETEPAHQAALGWLLMHWSKPFDSQESQRKIFASVERALSPPQREILQRRRRESPRGRV